jgi:hypothetical protein
MDRSRTSAQHWSKIATAAMTVFALVVAPVFLHSPQRSREKFCVERLPWRLARGRAWRQAPDSYKNPTRN